MICLAAGAVSATLALNAFTLTWVHSVQKSAIEEDWQVESDGLRVVETRIKGSAAGYDPPSDAVLAGGWWHYDPHLPPQRQVTLARSGAVADWRLCTNGACKPVSDYLPASAPRTGPVIIGICQPSRG
ncbi:MAG TPA: DUF1850 domain-containing protein [Alphaproteobacteria bacterium]|nr:DUF1850 domain-containing protein [Alphaproteobacteria bacterium]